MFRSRLRSIFTAALAFALAFTLVSPLAAHHGTAVSYDQDTWVTLEGRVVQYHWRNPHSSLFLEVTDAQGRTETYAIEMGSPSFMVRQGWTRDIFKAGDHVRLRVHPSRTGAPVGECLRDCQFVINGEAAQPNP